MEKTTERIKQLEKENIELKERLKSLEDSNTHLHYLLNDELNKINFERFTRLNYYYIKNNGLLKYLCAVFKSLNRVLRKAIKKIVKKITKFLSGNKVNKQLKEILKTSNYKEIFIFYPSYDWNMQMYQRPQHMAIHFSDNDVLFFYCTQNLNDNIDGFKKIKNNLYVTNEFNYLLKKIKKYTVYMYANMSGFYINSIKKTINGGNHILYEYIDDLNPALTDIPPELLERHDYVLKNDEIPVITTAQYLYDKAKSIRGSEKNILLSTNGVVYEDFHITKKLEIPSELKDIVKKNKTIIGYYGALASWFDYELIEKVAKTHTNWEIILIGIDYDKSLEKYNYFKHMKNIHYIGVVEYKKLINYGNCCNVLVIPFLINEITKSTSPVKVFEYMSMEKPIVTTDLPECKKYRSVLISKTHDDFIKNIEKALNLQNNKEYRELLKTEALENTWTKKSQEILKFKNGEK